MFDPADFEKFLHDRIKVEGKAGQLGEKIVIGKEGECGLESSSRGDEIPLRWCGAMVAVRADDEVVTRLSWSVLWGGVGIARRGARCALVAQREEASRAGELPEVP